MHFKEHFEIVNFKFGDRQASLLHPAEATSTHASLHEDSPQVCWIIECFILSSAFSEEALCATYYKYLVSLV